MATISQSRKAYDDKERPGTTGRVAPSRLGGSREPRGLIGGFVHIAERRI
jgi:hypothetical protein